MRSEFITWIGIALCVAQSALFSGLNLAVFSMSRLRLEVESAGGNPNAIKLLEFRKDSNLTLATILWGNVATNVLLTLLSESLLTGVAAFLLSTFLITFVGEIVPQAYFSRNALRVTGWFAPFLQIYCVFLFPIAKPTAIFLNWWLGPEGITLLRERDFRALMMKHVEATGTELWKRSERSIFLILMTSPCAKRENRSILAAYSLFPLRKDAQFCQGLSSQPMTCFFVR
jgi:CBS domain containing-hemolysin-like protein